MNLDVFLVIRQEKYTGIEKLMSARFKRVREKIIVHVPDKRHTGKRVQQVEIIYNCFGCD